MTERKHLLVIGFGMTCLTTGCSPLAPPGFNELFNDFASNPQLLENVEIIGAHDGSVFLVRNDLPDDLIDSLTLTSFQPDSADSTAAAWTKFDVGAVSIDKSQFDLIADDLVTSPNATIGARWLAWTDAQTARLIVLDRTNGTQQDFFAAEAEFSYHQILALDGDSLWLMRHEYLADVESAAPAPTLLLIDLSNSTVTDFGAALNETAFQIAIRDHVIYAFEMTLHPSDSDSENPANETIAIDFAPTAFDYRLVSFNAATQTRRVLIESLGTGITPADPQFDAIGRLLWREDHYDSLTTTVRGMTLPNFEVTTLGAFVGETPDLPDFESSMFHPTGRSSAVLHWNPRGLLIGQTEFNGGSEFFPDTTQRYYYRGFDGVEFDVFSFETNGLFASPITAIIDDTIVYRDTVSGDLLLTNIDTRETTRVALFPD